MLEALNPEQYAAVTLEPRGHALILAGAGSGKTRVLTTRIAWLLERGQATPGSILAVTFTNKAAKEMQARLANLLPQHNLRGMWMGTFHGLCNRLLRSHYQLAGLPAAFQILDMQDQQAAIKRLLKEQNLESDRYPPRQLASTFAHYKEDGLRPQDISPTSPESKQRARLYQLYEEQCQREGVVDFSELLLRSYELLRDYPQLRENYQQRFRFILVDEFQDTNRLQYQWLKLLAGEGNSGSCVMAVGDDDQSIYAFRGARVGNMQDFLREFAVEHQIKLERNYRSHGHILSCANALIENNSQRLGKNLITNQGEGEKVRLRQAPTDLDEARWIAEEVEALSSDTSTDIKRSQIAVLYRSNAQSRVIESRLFNAGIAYRVYGGMRFFERAEIKHALAYLRLLENPQDDTSFMRVVNFPARGIGIRSLEALQSTARQEGMSLYEATRFVGGAAGTKLQGFSALLQVMREAVAGQPLRQAIALVLQASGLEGHYSADKDGQDRLENLQELINAAESFVMQEGFGKDALALPLDEQAQQAYSDKIDEDTGETLSPLQAFLVHAALEAGESQAQASQDAVQLMTVHASKGLEFDAVFIAGLEEGLFPHENAINAKGGLEEERRLMYVAITRARKRLYVSYAQSRMLHGRTTFNLPSRFIDELPQESIQALGWVSKSNFQSLQSPRGIQPQQSAAASSSASGSIRKGQQVFHNKFGQGEVLVVEGSGSSARAQIHFSRHGVKWLALGIAKLTIVS